MAREAESVPQYTVDYRNETHIGDERPERVRNEGTAVEDGDAQTELVLAVPVTQDQDRAGEERRFHDSEKKTWSSETPREKRRRERTTGFMRGKGKRNKGKARTM